jgi:hypothetical protein
MCLFVLIPKSSHHLYASFFDGGPRGLIGTCHQILKASQFQYDTFLKP